MHGGGIKPLGLLSQDCRLSGSEFLEVEEARNSVPRGEAWGSVSPVFLDAPYHVSGDAQMERAAYAACEDVDPQLACHRVRHAREGGHPVATGGGRRKRAPEQETCAPRLHPVERLEDVGGEVLRFLEADRQAQEAVADAEAGPHLRL